MLNTIINFLFSRDKTVSSKDFHASSEAQNYYLQALQLESLCYTLQQRQAKRFNLERLEQQQSYQRNAIWNYLSAALRGHPEAQYRLGTSYLDGKLGLDQNEDQAKLWLSKAQQQGHDKAAQDLSALES